MTTEPTTKAAPACPQCNTPIVKPHMATIIDRAYDTRVRRQYVRQRSMTFCSDQCGGHYQCGCEG